MSSSLSDNTQSTATSAESNTADQRQTERYNLASEMLNQGKSIKEILGSLTQKGASKEQASAIMENVSALYEQSEMRKAIDNMSIGAFSAFMGILITIIGASGVGTDYRFLFILGGFGVYKGGVGVRDFLELKKAKGN